jgi:hypothetical protein
MRAAAAGLISKGKHMKIAIDWQEPEQITQHKRLLFDRNNIPDSIEERPGVYFFSRVHGNTIDPFYIGRSNNIRARLRVHLGSAKIRDILREVEEMKTVKKGVRFFSFGYLTPSKGSRDLDKVLALAERYLIRKALADGYVLINDHGTKFKTHDISFTGSKYERDLFGEQAEIPVERKQPL